MFDLMQTWLPLLIDLYTIPHYMDWIIQVCMNYKDRQAHSNDFFTSYIT